MKTQLWAEVFSLIDYRDLQLCSAFHTTQRTQIPGKWEVWKVEGDIWMQNFKQMPMMYQTSNVLLALLVNSSFVWTGCSIFFIWQLTDTMWWSKGSKKIKMKLTRFWICHTGLDWCPAPNQILKSTFPNTCTVEITCVLDRLIINGTCRAGVKL